MTSPFPGMDPYIEACRLWGDFHSSLIYKISESLAAAAPERYLVRSGERWYVELVEEEGKTNRPFIPDVSVAAPKKSRKKRGPKKGGVAVAEVAKEVKPVRMRAFIEEEHREAFVEIYEDTPGQRLVTSIEVLSPSNKRPNTEGWHLILRKRQSVMLAGVNLVEIDLLRGGQRLPMRDPWPDSPYVLLIAEAKKYNQCSVWPVNLQQRLPAIPIPLKKPDPPIPLDLQPMIEAIYSRFRYDRSIDYAKGLEPPLSAEETTWFKKWLRASKT